jgi:luciferase-like monooxygenase
VIEELASIPGVEVAPSQWTGEPALWVDGREIVHAHGEHIEIRLTGKLINALDDERAMRRARTSDWVLVDEHEHELILELARKAVEANREAD